MDARDYLARKGLDGAHDRERPNTQEEKAWSRAREAGEHRPRAGTPYDWEDWERYHEILAEGAEALEQKIDHEAHRRALEHGDGAGVSHFTPGQPRADKAPPAAGESDATRPSAMPSAARPEPYGALVTLAVLMPPLAIGLAGGGGRRVGLSIGLTLLGWLPGVAYAIHWLRRA